MKRRQFLQTASLGAGSVLLSPVLRQIHAQVRGDAPPLRFVFVLEGNGRWPKFMQPSGIEWSDGQYHTRVPKLIDQPLTAENKFPRGLAPLETIKDRVTVIQGLSAKMCAPGSHSANYGALGCCPGTAPDGTIKPLTETIDAALARVLPGVFPLLHLGLSRYPQRMVYNGSAWGANRPIPRICDPELAYSSVFGSVADGAARQQFNSDRNLLNFMVNDIKRVKPQLAAPEREKFEQHLSAFKSLRDQQSRLNEIEDTLREHAPVCSDKYKSDVPADRLDAHFDLGTAALIGGLTNVLTINCGGSGHMNVTHNGLGIDVEKHNLGHGTKSKGRDADECLDVIRAYYTQLIVRLVRRLEAVPEGDGTMMDNTLIFFTSDAANTHHPGDFTQWPLLVIGDLGGRLKTRGRFLGYPKYGADGHRTIANLFLTMLEMAGAPRETFGILDSNMRDVDQTGPLAELLA